MTYAASVVEGGLTCHARSHLELAARDRRCSTEVETSESARRVSRWRCRACRRRPPQPDWRATRPRRAHSRRQSQARRRPPLCRRRRSRRRLPWPRPAPRGAPSRPSRRTPCRARRASAAHPPESGRARARPPAGPRLVSGRRQPHPPAPALPSSWASDSRNRCSRQRAADADRSPPRAPPRPPAEIASNTGLLSMPLA